IKIPLLTFANLPNPNADLSGLNVRHAPNVAYAGAATGGGGKLSPTVIHDNRTINIHVPAVAAKDRNDLAEFLSRKLQHAANASSGNSVGRALATNGATRP